MLIGGAIGTGLGAAPSQTGALCCPLQDSLKSPCTVLKRAGVSTKDNKQAPRGDCKSVAMVAGFTCGARRRLGMVNVRRDVFLRRLAAPAPSIAREARREELPEDGG